MNISQVAAIAANTGKLASLVNKCQVPKSPTQEAFKVIAGERQKLMEAACPFLTAYKAIMKTSLQNTARLIQPNLMALAGRV
jgi:hypothetical protein